MADAEHVPETPEPKRKKRNWQKTLLKVLLGIVLALILLLFILVAFRNLLVTAALRSFLPKITGTPVTLTEFSSTLNGAVSLRELEIGNPPGYSRPYLLKFSSLYVKVDIPSLFGTMPVIEMVEINDAAANYELNKEGISNVEVIQNHIDGFLGAPAEEPETTDKAAPEPDNPVSPLLRRLVIRNAKVQSGSLSVPIPDITLENLGGTSSLRLALRRYFDPLMTSIRLTGGSMTQGVNAVGDHSKKLFQSGVDAGNKLKKSVVNLFNTTNKKEK